MTRTETHAGVCGFVTVVEATMDDDEVCHLHITSTCPGVQALAKELTELDPLEEIAAHGNGSRVHALIGKHCRHAACPVGIGILKAMEAEAGLALPKDVTITVTKGAG